MFKRIVLACIITTFLNANTCEPYKPIIDGCSDNVFAYVSEKLSDVDFRKKALVPALFTVEAIGDLTKDVTLDGLNRNTDFEASCNTHDVCYQTIGKSQAACDRTFRENMIDSCSKTYEVFEINEVIEYGTKKVCDEIVKDRKLKTLAFGAGYWVTREICKRHKYVIDYTNPVKWAWKKVGKEIYENTPENLRQILRPASYYKCILTAQAYFSAVESFGEEFYIESQFLATNYLTKLSNNVESRQCSNEGDIPSAENSNLFAKNDDDVINALYTNILRKKPSDTEFKVAKNISYETYNWEYKVTNKLEDEKVAILLVPIITSILFK